MFNSDGIHLKNAEVICTARCRRRLRLACSESKATDSKCLKTQSIAMLRFDVEPFEVVEDSEH